MRLSPKRRTRLLFMLLTSLLVLKFNADWSTASVNSTRALREALRQKGWKDGADLAYFEPAVSAHKPGAWGPGIDRQLKFLFPPNTSERSR